MRLWPLLLLFLCHCAASELFENCDEMTTLCYVLVTCKGNSDNEMELVRVAQSDVGSLTCRVGFRLDFSTDGEIFKWSVTMERSNGDQTTINNIGLSVKNGETTVQMADCSQQIKTDLYKADKQSGDKSNCNVKVESILINRIKEPLADVFHLSYGQSEFCLEVEFAEGKKSSYCTKPIRFNVFNTDCQDNKFVETQCHPDHKICEPATEKDNVFSCPDQAKNMIFIDNTFVSNSNEVRCTKAGWRSADTSKLSIGHFLMREKTSPQCVSLCENHFIRTTDETDSDSQPTITGGEMTCGKLKAPIIYGEFYSGKITCAESKWTTQEGKTIESEKGVVMVKCGRQIDPFLSNDCSSGLNTKADSCASFDRAKKGNLMCLQREALVVYKGVGYDMLTLSSNVWKNDDLDEVGPIEQNVKPYCVYTCSDYFLNVKCDERQSCSLAQFNGAQYDNNYGDMRLYKSALQCQDSDSIIIMDSKAQTGPKIDCARGSWSSDGEKILTVIDHAKGTDKRLDVYCHKNCHESLLLNDCNGEPGCRSASMAADKTVACEDDTYFIEASADAWKTRTTEITTIFSKKEFKNLQCSKDGWIGDGETVIDFKQYPQNDISVNCRSRCSEKFVKCEKTLCPKIELPNLKCKNDDNVWMNEKPAMQDLSCDPKTGWHEKGSNKLIVDFAEETVNVNVKCINSCTEEIIEDDCAGHAECKPKLVDKKLTCEGAGRVMRVNGQLEFDHLTCSREFWTKTKPAATTIPRATHDEKIKVACLSKCHDSFIKHSPCVDDKSCDKHLLNGPDHTHLTCTLPTDYIVVNSIVSATPFVCDPVRGWTNDAGETVGDFANDDLHVTAHCLRNCDVSRIEDDCKGGKSCQKFTYTNDVLSCLPGFVLNVNNRDIFEDIRCEARGFRTSSDEFLLKFDVTNTEKRIGAKCVSKCDEGYVKKLNCDGQEKSCTEPIINPAASTIKCKDKNDLLILGSTPVFSSSLHCDPTVGWKEGNNVIHDLTGTDVNVEATCRQPCDRVTIHDDSAALKPFIKNKPLKCHGERNHRLFLNDSESGEVVCDSGGWKKVADGKYAVKFNAQNAGDAVVAECRHKCNPRFVKQVCGGAATCTDAIYNNKHLGCPHESELLVINDKENFEGAFLYCTNDGWTNGAEPTSRLIIDMKTTVNYLVQVQCIQLCHPDFITQKDGAAPFKYSLGEKLTCNNDMEMLIAQTTSVYSDLTCSKDGWRNEKKELLISFDKVRNRKIVAGCEENDCMSRGFAPPCNTTEVSKECRAPERTAYSLFCQDPFKLVPNLETFIHYSSAHCKDGKWSDGNGNHIAEGDETPMRFQCFAAGCTNCTNTLPTDCNQATDPNCSDRTFVPGSKKYCSRYECHSSKWWRIAEIGDGGAKYAKGTVTCGQNGVEYDFRGGEDWYTITSGLDCIKKVPCSAVSPLNTKCDGLTVTCEEEFLDEQKSSPEKPVTCPAPSQIYHETGVNQWETGTKLTCDEEGQWTFEVEAGEKRSIAKGARVICASDDPYIPTTTALPTTSTLDPSHPCIGCRAVFSLAKCDGCASEEEGYLIFDHKGRVCYAKTSSQAFEVDGQLLYYQTLKCEFENGEYVWRTEDGARVSAFAAHKSKPPMFAGAKKIGAVIGIVVLILAGIAGIVLFVWWYRVREAQKREAASTRGLEQKNDSIIDEIQVDEPKTIKL